MAKKVGSIYAEIRARLDKFERDLNKAHTQTRKSTRRIQKSIDKISFDNVSKSFRKFQSLLGAGLAIGGVGGIGALINESIRAADELGKVADKLGLSTTALQEYQFAASQSGVQQQTLNMALQRFARRVGEATQGKGELKDTLIGYNIAVRDAVGNTRDINDVLDDLANVIANAESEQEALRIAFKAFDSEGAALVNMLKNGSIGLEEFRRKANQLGLVIGEDIIRKSEEARNKIDQLGKTLKAIFTKAVLSNIDAITAGFERLINIAARIAIAFAPKPEMQKLQERLVYLNERLTELNNSFAATPGQVRGLELAIARVKNQMAALLSTTDNTHESFKLTGERSGTLAVKFDETAVKAESASKSVKEYTFSLNKLNDEQLKIIQNLGTFGAGGRAGGIIGAFGIGAEEQLSKQQEKLLEAANQEADLIRKIKETTLAERQEALEAVENTSNRMIELTERTAWAMQGNFSNLFFDFMKGELKTLEDYANAVFDSISRAISDLLAQWAVQSIFGDLTTIGGGGGLLGQIFGNAKGNIFNSGKVEKMYRGGIVSGPTLYPAALMGEAGPEAVLPLTRTASGELGVKAESGSSVVQNFYFNVSSPTGRIEQNSINELQLRAGTAARRAIQRNG